MLNTQNPPSYQRLRPSETAHTLSLSSTSLALWVSQDLMDLDVFGVLGENQIPVDEPNKNKYKEEMLI